MDRDTVVLIHGILGGVVFLSGFLQIVLKKGGTAHRIIGNIYLYAWLFLLLTGAYIGELVITIIGIFGFYYAITGSRIGSLKGRAVGLFEKGLFVAGGLFALSLLFYAIKLYLSGTQSWWIICAVFGVVFLFQGIKDIPKYVFGKPPKKNLYGDKDWIFEHFTRMCISFIAAFTAFVSIQNVFN